MLALACAGGFDSSDRNAERSGGLRVSQAHQVEERNCPALSLRKGLHRLPDERRELAFFGDGGRVQREQVASQADYL
jgi:hypothetical protein